MGTPGTLANSRGFSLDVPDNGDLDPSLATLRMTLPCPELPFSLARDDRLKPMPATDSSRPAGVVWLQATHPPTGNRRVTLGHPRGLSVDVWRR